MSHDLLFQYIRWHYRDGLAEVLHNAELRVFGFLNYFSIRPLASSLLAPWHRITEGYGRGFDPKTFLTVLIGNLMSRVIGAGVRLSVIAAGLLVVGGAAVFGLGALIVWIALPLAIPLLPIAGVLLLIA